VGGLEIPWNILCHLIVICVVTGLLSGTGWKIVPVTLRLKGDSGLSFLGVGWKLLPSTLPYNDQIQGYFFAFSPE
jgi:hypothetical protein